MIARQLVMLPHHRPAHLSIIVRISVSGDSTRMTPLYLLPLSNVKQAQGIGRARVAEDVVAEMPFFLRSTDQ